MKTCCRCNKQQSLIEFSYDASRLYGHMYRCKTCDSELKRLWRAENPQRAHEIGYNSRQKLRQEVLDHYGSECACCGETKREFLAIDHINGDGAQHRREIGRGGWQNYAWIKRNNFPENLRILCHNCDQARGNYGYCPHDSN